MTIISEYGNDVSNTITNYYYYSIVMLLLYYNTNDRTTKA